MDIKNPPFLAKHFLKLFHRNDPRFQEMSENNPKYFKDTIIA